MRVIKAADGITSVIINGDDIILMAKNGALISIKDKVAIVYESVYEQSTIIPAYTKESK